MKQIQLCLIFIYAHPSMIDTILNLQLLFLTPWPCNADNAQEPVNNSFHAISLESVAMRYPGLQEA